MEEQYENHEEEGDLMYEAHAKVDALIDLLVKKGIITEDEYDQQVESLLTELGDDDDDDEEECTCGNDPCTCDDGEESCGGCTSEEKPAEHQGCCGCA
jgi:hypothetical protein